MSPPFLHLSASSPSALGPHVSSRSSRLGAPIARPACILALHSRETRQRLSTCLFFCVALSAPAASAFADDRDRLTSGLYVAATVGCDGLGGGGTVDFDGKNFSPHYQACLTQPLAQNARYRQTCVEGQGPSYPTTAQIQGDPSKTTRDVTIAVLSENSFTLNGARYDYCGAR
jgi:hypothetical protein